MTASMGSSFIIALAAIIVLAMFISIVLFANWWQNHHPG